ncbi:MAG: lipoyl domain-containing protein [Desulfurococcales archaeon]|nr:lipoyl domain-containing protein [Desulfurococcales archaeon]
MAANIIVPRELWPRRSDWTGIVVEVYKKEGDRVEQGDTLIDVEIEKAVIAIDSPINGIVNKVYVSKGDKIRPDTILMSIREE